VAARWFVTDSRYRLCRWLVAGRWFVTDSRYRLCRWLVAGRWFVTDSRYRLCRWLVAGRWYSHAGYPGFFNKKANRHDIIEILLKAALNTITQTLNPTLKTRYWMNTFYWFHRHYNPNSIIDWDFRENVLPCHIFWYGFVISLQYIM
jgi:hypothetical protein